jgi:hypothetical protein
MKTEDTTFEDSYKDTLAMLELKSKNKSFDITDIQGELSSLYVYEGHDWVGRGESKNSEISGEICAYQVFIHNY